MNKMWAILFLVLPLIGTAYSLWHIWNILPLPNLYKSIVTGILLILVFWFFANFAIFNIDNWPMPLARASYEVGNSTLFVLLYTVLLFLVLDIGRLVHLIPRSFMVDSCIGTLTVVGTLIVVFTYGYLNYLHKVRVPIELSTTKNIESPKKIVMIADLHIGYHNNRKELATWIDKMNAEKPDLILIGGDIIDRNIRPILEENMAEEFRRLEAPVYACLGNHEYYSGKQDAEKFYKDANINLLIDQSTTVHGINIIGRDDHTNAHRKSVKALTADLDMNRYTILLDHQPHHLEQAEQAGIDFQLSGHTHYGQMWPINWIENAIYEDAYGPLTKGNTQYYVTSGIGIWGGKFRVGTQSEYVVATLTRQ
ncbi:MAG: metallophosphoesterase [Prevotella sp.]|jgi:predicted MPP superfamily phosphohydrolase